MKFTALKSVFGYGTATLLQGIVAFLTVPLLIRVVGSRDFALWAIFEPIVLLLAQLSLMGASHGYIRLLSSGSISSRMVFTLQRRFGLLPAFIISTLGALTAILYLGFQDIEIMIVLAAFYAFLESFILLTQSVARGLSDVKTYTLTVWVKYGLIGSGLAGLNGLNITLPITTYLEILILIDLLVLLIISRSKHADNIVSTPFSFLQKRSIYFGAIRYGMPIVVSAGLSLLVANGDRYVVDIMLPSEKLAGYVTMAKLAGALSFAAAPINLWWPAARFRHAQDSDYGAAFFSAATNVLLIYYLCAAACMWVITPQLISWYAHDITGFDNDTMGLLLCASVATAMITPMNIGTLNEGKTHWSIWTIGFSAVVGLGLAFFLIPKFGYVGAAFASLCAQIASLWLVRIISQRIQPMIFNYFKPFTLLIFFGGLIFTIMKLPDQVSYQLAAITVFLLITGFITASDIRKLIQL